MKRSRVISIDMAELATVCGGRQDEAARDKYIRPEGFRSIPGYNAYKDNSGGLRYVPRDNNPAARDPYNYLNAMPARSSVRWGR